MSGRQSTVVSRYQRRGATYSKLMDKRKRPIRSRWERNGRYYAQLAIEAQFAGIKPVKPVPTEGVSTDAQAVAKLQELLTQRRNGALPVLKRTPLFTDSKVIYALIRAARHGRNDFETDDF